MNVLRVAFFACACALLVGCGTRVATPKSASPKTAPTAAAVVFDCNGQELRVDTLADLRIQLFFTGHVHEPIVLDATERTDTEDLYSANDVRFVMRGDDTAILSLAGESATVTCARK